MKNCAVIISGLPAGNNVREITVQPGATAGDVLRELSLDGYLLSREGSAQAFANEENLYAAILDDGAKLRATPIAEVGGLIDDLLEFLGFRKRVVVKELVARNDTNVTSPRPQMMSKPGAAVYAKEARTTVGPDGRQLWEVRGWRRDGEKLVGAYRTPHGSFVGEISLTNDRRPDYYIVNPPKAILRGSHSACFRNRGKKRYFVHFGVVSPDVDAGIVAIEKLIANSLRGRA